MKRLEQKGRIIKRIPLFEDIARINERHNRLITGDPIMNGPGQTVDFQPYQFFRDLIHPDCPMEFSWSVNL